MKIITGFVILFAGIFIFNGCKKDALGEKKIIEGIIYYHYGTPPQNTVAPAASVFVTYDSKEYTGVIDQTVITDSKGAYRVKGLKKGDYFVTATYTSSSGFVYTTLGHWVTLESGKNKASLNLLLY